MKKNYIILLLIICTIEVSLGFLFGMEKVNLHVDEIYSFGLSNNTTGTMMSIPEGELIDRSVFDQYVTVDLAHRFDFTNVWANQKADVHPPFYYLLIHTICSFFPGKFLMMGGIGLNILFSVIITLLIYFTVKELSQNEMLSLLISAVWSVSLGNMTFIVFIRMYMMLTAFMLAITLLHIKYVSKKLTLKFYLGVVLLAISGTLTQYYFLIYLFFLCFLFVLHLLLNKDIKSALLYLLSLSCAGIGAVFIFPGMLYHIFKGYRGKESFQNIENFSNLSERFIGYYNILNKELFNQVLTFLILIILLLLIVSIRKRTSKINWRAVVFSGYNLLLFPSLLYFIIVSKIAIYVTDRYIMPIFPMLLIAVILGVTYLSFHVVGKRYLILFEACCFIILSAIGLIQNKNIDNLHKESEPAIQFAEDNKKADVLVVYTGAWRLNSVYVELTQYNQVRVITKKNLANFIDTIDNYNDAIVYIIGNDYEDTLVTLMSMNPSWTSYTSVNSTQYSHVYQLRSSYEN
ncbi:dolichyl-phosphate-mannose-protein mannosyltransferase [Lachnotalea glycerini]|uniref:Dolichyl-phosphate-mannose-protein mannosyltransferase n=1 Tax=Lachnotalea glycerini TaxID=1763509 RepID=A0A318EPF7_9FIRM|nr:glycosyltransferase family 39 protein [Lachnotalea glycerini]PXV91464.1 dolichyl-phosphate-mannose-protein mannosyltransferase [Lachnotalea glycerini]